MLIVPIPNTRRARAKRSRRAPEEAPDPRARPTRTPPPAPAAGRQVAAVGLTLSLLFGAIVAQLAALAQKSASPTVAISAAIEAPATTYSRPDIVDRNGRLMATDVEVNSLYADPSRIIDRDEAIERLAALLPDIDTPDLRRALWDRTRHFAWIKRGLSPRMAQAVHDLGLPGFGFRHELRRVYPLGAMAGHILGRVDIDNRGTAGIERWIDETVGIDGVHLTRASQRPPVRLSLEIGAQAGMEAELADAMARYHAAAAAAILLDVGTGEIVAAASVPRIEPARAADAADPAKRDRLQGGTYELGSIFKLVTLAEAIDAQRVTLDTSIDVRQPLLSGRFEIKDLHAAGRPLSVREIFLLSSNVGAGLLALAAGSQRQQDFLRATGLMSPLTTQAGPVAPPVTPDRWGRTEAITIAYGHGIAVAPLQFAAAAASLLNGGLMVHPTYLRASTGGERTPSRVVSAETSRTLAAVMRANVTDPIGTGHRADVAGFDVGGKTGTADIAGPRGYKQGGVISSFLATFPTSAPRYVALVVLFEPKPSGETGGKVLAGLTAAPVAGRIIARIGPLLD